MRKMASDAVHGHQPNQMLKRWSEDAERKYSAAAIIPGNRNAYIIGPLINIPPVSNPNMIQRSLVTHGWPSRIFFQTKIPTAKIASASGMSERTRVASRGLRRLKPNAEKAIKPATFPYAREPSRNSRNAINAAQINDGSRHPRSHDLVVS